MDLVYLYFFNVKEGNKKADHNDKLLKYHIIADGPKLLLWLIIYALIIYVNL